MISETKIIFMTMFYSFFKNYSTSASKLFREAFYHHYLQTVKVKCKSVDIVFVVRQKVHRPFNDHASHT